MIKNDENPVKKEQTKFALKSHAGILKRVRKGGSSIQPKRVGHIICFKCKDNCKTSVEILTMKI